MTRERADAEGNLVLPPIPEWSPQATLIALPEDSARWRIRTPWSASPPIWGEHVWQGKVTSSGANHVLVIDELLPVSIGIRFADGVPFTGVVRVALDGPDREPMLDRTLPLTEASMFHLEAVNGFSRARVICTSARPGFQPRHELLLEPAAFWSATEIVVPAQAEESQCGLIVDLSGYRAEDGWEFLLHTHSSARQHIGVIQWGEEFRTLELVPGRTYTAAIRGPGGLVWQSDPIVAVQGTVTRLTPEVARSGSVRMRVTDDSGKPLFPAYVSLHEASVPWWEMAVARNSGFQRPDQGVAYGGQNGVVALDGIPLTVTRLYVEALDHERVVVPVVLVPGEVLDIGVVRLGAPSGSLTVRLEGYPPDQAYVLTLRAWGGGAVAQHEVKPGVTEVQLRALPFRNYSVSMGVAVGHRVDTLDASKEPVELSVAAPTATVTLDYANRLFK